tara:strand:+ start:674 stop:1513 length:840 start_codon:yes stop_codon:yes gene_type:complete
MKTKILLATDFSKNAQNAIEYAINLYKQDTCEFYILNTYNVGPSTMELAAISDLEAFKRKSITGLSTILEGLSNIHSSKNHQFHVVSECGSLIDIMQKLIDIHDIDIVVMGTKGGTDSKTQIYGSKTALVMESIRDCPVLAIPAKAIFKGIKNIVFPTGYKTPYKRREFQYLVDIAKKTGAAICVLHVMAKEKELDEDQRMHQELLKDFFEGIEYTFHIINDGKVQLALNSYLENHEIDMVAFINKKHNFFSWHLSKPMVKNLAYHSTIPILALHDFRN